MTNLVQFPGLGLSFQLNRVAFTIGGVSIYWYGVCIAVGLCLALVFAFRHSLEFGVDPDSMVDVILIGVVLGIISARAYYVAMAPFKYESIWEMIAIRDGGLAIYGGIIGGFLFGGLACKWRGVPVLPMFDLTAMGFLIGQGCGRWGNFFNQEAFGCNTTLPWGMYSEATRAYLMSSTVTVPKGVVIDPNLPVHPTFLYESIWCFVGFFLLFRYIKKRKFNGDITLRYLVWYGAGRFWIEGLRTDSLMLVPSIGLRDIPAGGRRRRGGGHCGRGVFYPQVQGQAFACAAGAERREQGGSKEAGRSHLLCREGHPAAGLQPVQAVFGKDRGL